VLFSVISILVASVRDRRVVHLRASSREADEGRAQRLLRRSGDQRRRPLAFRKKNTATGRSINEEVTVGLVSHTYGPCLVQTFERTQIRSGTFMEAVLGPDQSNVSSRYKLGTKTNSNSLRPFMQALAGDSRIQGWVAGHLLNEEMGGQGDVDENLTPLTTKANGAHKAYEAHIKKMLLQCHNVDRDNKGNDEWYGVRYRVEAIASKALADLIDTYVASYLSITYEYVTIKKDGFPGKVEIKAVGPLDPHLQTLKIAGRPTCTSPNAENERCNPFNTGFEVEIHNEI
jgi:hypothetical protein